MDARPARLAGHRRQRTPGMGSAGPEERTLHAGRALAGAGRLRGHAGHRAGGDLLRALRAAHGNHRQHHDHFHQHPLLVPTKGSVDVAVEAYSSPLPNAPHGRRVTIEAFAPGLMQVPVRVLKIEATVFSANASADVVYKDIVAPAVCRFGQDERETAGDAGLDARFGESAPEDRRRFSRIVDPVSDAPEGSNGKSRLISESAWQCKIPRVLTEVIDHLRNCEPYQAEVKAYYSGRNDETERRVAIRRYAEKGIEVQNLAGKSEGGAHRSAGAIAAAALCAPAHGLRSALLP